MKAEIRERLTLLRKKMQDKGIDYYLIPTADYHNSEYVSDYFKVREYFSGFTGSNGSLLVWQEGAGLWTDGRYFIQAARELEDTDITLFKMGEEKVPTITAFLKEQMKEGAALGFDGKVVIAREGLRLEDTLKSKGVTLCITEDLSADIWTDRPAFPKGTVTILPEELTGMSVSAKLDALRKRMQEEGADGLFISKLDNIMWTLNIRGCDVECNPVAMSYLYLTQNDATVFLAKEAVSAELADYLQENHISIYDYTQVPGYLEKLSGGQTVWTDTDYCSYAYYQILNTKKDLKILNKKDPAELLKAVKNPVELAHMREIYLKDSVAVTRFIYWLKNSIGNTCGVTAGMGEITEVSAADYLEQCRHDIPEFCGLSFPTIAGYQANAAMMHYEATDEKHAVLKPEGMLLVDSGGQYLGGTTDVTRTIVLGDISEEMKIHYTAVAAGMLELTNAVWLYGCTGRNLDILARRPIWEIGLDYKCGTGHGVGYMLNVHEGPQSMRWRYIDGISEAVLEEGMDITNEPGIYIEGSHGIRIENVMVVRESTQNEYGRFMRFETLTWVPIDMQAVDVLRLTEKQKAYLRDYQNKVYEKLSPHLSEEEKDWLYMETRCDF